MKTIFTSLTLLLALCLPSFAGATNSLRIDPFEIMADSEIEVPVIYESDDDFTGFQTCITLPAGLSFVDKGSGYATLAESASESHQITSNLDGSTLKVVSFSAQNAILPAGSTLFTITVRSTPDFEGGDLTLTNTIFSDTANQDVSFDDTTTQVSAAVFDPFTYSYNDEDMTATVTGLADWVTELKDPVIPETTNHDGKIYTVTVIGESAFYDNTKMSGSLTIGNSITTIGNYAFYNCSSLTGSLSIPNSVTKIEYQSFYGCSGFTGSLTIPDSVTGIGSSAFFNCSGFTGSLVIPNSITYIEYRTFANCSGFTGSLIIPNSVYSIGAYAFQGCAGFDGILIIGNSVTDIGEHAFAGCSGFTGSLTIPESVTDISNYAFYGCSGFTGSLTIPNSVTEIWPSAFERCTGFDGSLIIGNSVTSIDGQAFADCSGFTGSLTIPESVTKIGNSAFYGCSGFTGSLTIPESVTKIGSSAFAHCRGFTGSLIIPNSITNIEYRTFASCFGFTGSLTIPNSVTSIGEGAFQWCQGFDGTLTISNSVTTIGEQAFFNCINFTGSLNIPNSVTEIGKAAFFQCFNFTGSLNIPNSVTKIEDNTFYKCMGLTGTLIIPESIEEIGAWAFTYCSGFTGSLTIPNSVTNIGSSAFLGCTGLSGTLKVPKTITSIKGGAFYKTNITDISVLNSTPPELIYNSFGYESGEGYAFEPEVTIRVITGAREVYRTAEGWNTYEKLYEFGDANFDKNLSVSDAVAVANDIVGAPNVTWDRPCADINFDDAITISDATSIISAVMEYAPTTPEESSRMKAPSYCTGKLVAADFSLDERGDAIVPVIFDSANELVAMQIDFTGGDELNIEDVEVCPSIAETHSVKTQRLEDGSMRVVIFSLAGNRIESTNEPLFRVRLHGNYGRLSGGRLSANGALASTRGAEDVALVYSGGSNSVITGINDTEAEGTIVYASDGQLVILNATGINVTVYDAAGQRIDMFKAMSDMETRSLPGGLYIVCVENGKYKILI